MIISSNIPPRTWTSIEAKTLRDFLHSDTGRLALEWTAFHAPELLDGADKNKTLVASGEVKGWQGALSALVNLTVEQPVDVEVSESYPSLDDDAAWKTTEPEKPNQKTT